MQNAISVEAIGKRFVVGEREAYGSLRDSLVHAAKAPFARLSGNWKPHTDATVWALKDVSFEIGDGDIVGIIGRNGSGKSTLLKILSRIMEPTSGRAVVRGRVGSLLEVGTGFHPELTGRENVFVNGAILGMRKAEIARKFDEIVAFADIDRFIDTPVKRYSSGMQMRLAFAVAAHLEPEILLVDEVLAVGDLEFQRRCLGKMEDVSRAGRTVILVSHQLGQIRRLCPRTLWLDRGTLRHFGDTGETLKRYEAAMTAGSGEAHHGQCFTRWEVVGQGHALRDAYSPFTIRIGVSVPNGITNGHFGLSILDDEDNVIAGWAFEPINLTPGQHTFDVTIPQLPLQPRNYRLSLALFDQGNNLTGGRLVEKWSAVPHLTLDVPPVGHPQDEWAGVLNVRASLSLASS